MFTDKQRHHNRRLAQAFLAEANRQTLYAPDLHSALNGQEYLARALKHWSQLAGWMSGATSSSDSPL